MNESDITRTFYTIGEVAMCTGLTDRTIRNYISLGLLEGEKVDGAWRFTPEQVEKFMYDPVVRPSIHAKKNALVYDFLLDEKKQESQCCIILDLPHDDKRKITQFFCTAISSGEYENIRFSFDSSAKSTPRVILKGAADDVLGLVERYRSK